jgi:hypothetical protein
MVAPYYDEAAGYVPRAVMNRWGVALLVGISTVSLIFLARSIVGQFPDEGDEER